METAVYIIFMIAALYLFAGSLFAIYFLTKGIEKLDGTMQGSGWGFRLIILPGTIMLWPVLLKKMSHVKKDKS